MIKTYTFKVKPNNSLFKELDEWLNITRCIYNLGKEVREDAWRKGVSLNYNDLSGQLTQLKKEFKWIYKVNSQSLQASLERLESGYKKFFSDIKNGVKTSKPKWAKKKKWNSIYFKDIKIKNGRYVLPSLGSIKVFKFKVPKGELKVAILKKEIDGWYLKVVVDKQSVQKSENQGVVGIDMGLKYFLTTSEGEFVDNPKHLEKFLKKLRVENRKLSRCRKGSKNFYKQVRVLQKLHLKISRVRLDFLQKESTKLSSKYSTIVIEDLDIKGMSKNSKLSHHILDCAWGKFFELLEYKSNVVRIKPEYTSQKCSNCGHTCEENRKTQSHFECVKCDYIENADLNASFNILKLGQELLEANVDH